MANHYTTITHQSWVSKFKGSFGASFFGLLLLIGSISLLWWNEGRAVKTARGLDEGASVITEAINNSPNDKTEGKLIHLTDLLSTDEELTDIQFGISENCLKLERVVEMYQWKETKKSKTDKNVGGSSTTKTDIYYEKIWSKSIIDSKDFERIKGHTNPNNFTFTTSITSALEIKLGAFKLSTDFDDLLNDYEPIKVNQSNINISEKFSIITESNDGDSYQKVFIGNGTPINPIIGDIKVYFKAVKVGTYSAIAQQQNDNLVSFKTEENTSIILLEKGTESADIMFQEAHRSNNFMKWFLRITGIALLFFSFMKMGAILIVITDFIPFLSTILTIGLGGLAAVFTFVIASITIAIAWIYFRPIIGTCILVVALGTGLFFYKKWSTKK